MLNVAEKSNVLSNDDNQKSNALSNDNRKSNTEIDLKLSSTKSMFEEN